MRFSSVCGAEVVCSTRGSVENDPEQMRLSGVREGNLESVVSAQTVTSERMRLSGVCEGGTDEGICMSTLPTPFLVVAAATRLATSCAANEKYRLKRISGSLTRALISTCALPTHLNFLLTGMTLARLSQPAV